MQKLVAMLVVALAAPSTVVAQDVTAARQQRAAVDTLGSPGLRAAIEREAARLATDSPDATAARSRQAPPGSWPGRHPVVLGMLIGLGGGVAWGSAQYYEGQDFFGPLVVFGGGVGLGIGAGVGAIVSAVRR